MDDNFRPLMLRDLSGALDRIALSRVTTRRLLSTLGSNRPTTFAMGHNVLLWHDLVPFWCECELATIGSQRQQP